MQFEVVYRELLQSTEIIGALLRGVSPEDARVKPDEESWSMLEVLCHLCDEELEDFREHLDFVLHRQGGKWKTIDPQAWVVQRKYNQQDLVSTMARFQAERAKSLDWLKTLEDADWDVAYTSEYGTISAGAMLCSWIAHDNLHTRQLVELRRFLLQRFALPYAVDYAGDW